MSGVTISGIGCVNQYTKWQVSKFACQIHCLMNKLMSGFESCVRGLRVHWENNLMVNVNSVYQI